MTDNTDDGWIFFRDVNFADTNIMQYHVDTRDFHVSRNTEKYPSNGKYKIDIYNALKNHEMFFYTAEEVVALLDRYFNDSGGSKEWRFFFLEYEKNYWLKYIRIHRFEQGLIICDSEHHPLNKEITNSKVGKDEN